MARVAINGLGRIGRATFKIVLDTPGLELIAANELAPLEDVVYLLKHDTVYGRRKTMTSRRSSTASTDRIPPLRSFPVRAAPRTALHLNSRFSVGASVCGRRS